MDINLTKPAGAKFVWYDDHGLGRNRFASFRYRFELRALPSEAMLHLFADNCYQLFLNGQFVHYGPSRFDIRRPQFDSVPLREHLQVAENVVAVLVQSFGCKTFRDNSERGGFVAWGSVDAGDGTVVDFSTGGSSGWKTKRCEAYDEHAVKMSFALEPIAIYEQAKEDAGWTETGYDDGAWASPVVLKCQDGWGPLEPRSIPMMERTDVSYTVVGGIDPLTARERVLGFALPTPEYHSLEGHSVGRDRMSVGVATYVHSACAQVVTVGATRGRYQLEGALVESVFDVDRLRLNLRLPLQEGWSHLFAALPVLEDCCSFMLALPEHAGLTASAEKRFGDGPPLALQQLRAQHASRRQQDPQCMGIPGHARQRLGMVLGLVWPLLTGRRGSRSGGTENGHSTHHARRRLDESAPRPALGPPACPLALHAILQHRLSRRPNDPQLIGPVAGSTVGQSDGPTV